MSNEVLTYRELAERMGVKPESARKAVRRKGWQRVQGNDGTVRIMVPADALPSPNDDAGDASREVEMLETQIVHLQEILDLERRRAEVAEQDRDRWHTLASRPWWRRLAG